MNNRLISAYDKKQMKAEKVEDKFQNKRNRLSVKVSKSKTQEKAAKKFQKIRVAEQKTYNKLKAIESKKGTELEGRPKQFMKGLEKEMQIEKESRQDIRPNKYYGNPIQ